MEQLESFHAAVIGPGLSTNSETIHLIWQILFQIEIPAVVDADALSALAKGIEVMRSKESIEFVRDYFSKAKAPLILTPHPGEAARIIKAMNIEGYKKLSAKDIEDRKEEAAALIADNLGTLTILKGHNTVIAESHGRIAVNQIGGPELATAGSGDVLSGIIGSFIGQNPSKIFEAATTAVFLHGKSGIIARDKLGERSVMASDIIRYLPEAIKESEKEI
jgi:NAD(P)H-hydrate epimerase